MSTYNNKIEIYAQNSNTVICTTSTLVVTGYTPYLTVKKKTTDEDIIFTKIGSVTDVSTVAFVLSSTDTSLAYGDYVYDITVECDASIYTVAKDKFVIIDSVRY